MSVKEVVLEREGKSVRPFLIETGVKPRSCSMPLERRVVDFGSDVAFNEVPKKLQEHYKIDLCIEIVRKITLRHAEGMGDYINKENEFEDREGVEQLIAEADGGMVPIVEVEEEAVDKRKTRKVFWKEAKLCFSRDTKKAKGIFRATLKSTEEAGDNWFNTALQAGLGNKTKVHSLGDGAKWIKEQADRVFGGKSKYLVDFYHVSEYLAAVGNDCEKESKKWLKEQQARLKGGNLYKVLQDLEEKLYGESEPPESVKSCYRYLTNRMEQMDYLGAIMEDLPIGSGEIESGHRHVVQKRMKKAGSWWKGKNAEKMLQLLTVRANGFWDGYWDGLGVSSLREAA